MKKRYIVIFILAILAIIGSIFYLSVQPSNERNWTQDQRILAHAQKQDNYVTIYNIRNFSYSSSENYSVNYYNKTFDLNTISSIDYFVVPFGNWYGPAHTMLSFGFGDEYVTISVEIRKEINESFSALKGLFKQYEIMYVVADERDVVKLRTSYRKNTVYMYPVNTTKQNMQLLFVDMINKINELNTKPEFYNTVTNSCTQKIVQHANKIRVNDIGVTYKTILPAYSGQLAFDLGLLNMTEFTPELYNISAKAIALENESNFSVRLRST